MPGSLGDVAATVAALLAGVGFCFEFFGYNSMPSTKRAWRGDFARVRDDDGVGVE